MQKEVIIVLLFDWFGTYSFAVAVTQNAKESDSFFFFAWFGTYSFDDSCNSSAKDKWFFLIEYVQCSLAVAVTKN